MCKNKPIMLFNEIVYLFSVAVVVVHLSSAVIYRDWDTQCRVNANRGPWQLFARAPLLTRDKDLSRPATRVDTTCWQLFRPVINTAHFYVLLQKLCQITRLLTG